MNSESTNVNLLEMLLSYDLRCSHRGGFQRQFCMWPFQFPEFKGRTCDDSSQHIMCLPMYKDAEIPEIPSQFAILNWYGQHGHLLQTLACRARLGTCKIHCSFSPAVFLQVAGPEGELSKGHNGLGVGLTGWCFSLASCTSKRFVGLYSVRSDLCKGLLYFSGATLFEFIQLVSGLRGTS